MCYYQVHTSWSNLNSTQVSSSVVDTIWCSHIEQILTNGDSVLGLRGGKQKPDGYSQENTAI